MLQDEEFINALNTVLTGVQMGQKRGVYSLEESAIIYESVKKIQSAFESIPQQPPEPEPVVKESKKKKTSE